MSNASEYVSFLQYHVPALDAGQYKITATQTLTVPSGPTPFAVEKTILVAGDRFSVQKSQIQACFPPPGNMGDYSSDLPHILLNRSTLPWERFAQSGNKTLPWLWLFIFDDEDIKKGNVKVTSGPIQNFVNFDGTGPSTATIALASEAGEVTGSGLSATYDPKTVNVVQINTNWATDNNVIPDKMDLPLMTGVRVNADASQLLNENDSEGVTELAMCIANRLPQPGVKTYAHLLSLEGRYNEASGVFETNSEDELSFVSLTNWSFMCTAESAESFSDYLLNVDCSDFKLPDLDTSVAGASIANQYLQRGAVALPHHLKAGGEVISWYHGPLITGLQTDETSLVSLPVQSSDELLRLDDNLGMLDTSYAAAWELGRMLTLNNKGLSMKMYAWKRQQSWSQQQAEYDIFYDLLPIDRQNAQQQADLNQWEEIKTWFRSLNLLENIPFNYLVPDENLLPEESIRFFQLDNLWISCLLDGAYSIGRVTQTETQRDATLNQGGSDAKYPQVSGFLLRSQAVNGWPTLMVEATTVEPTASNPVPPTLNVLRMDRLGSDVLLCLFEGEAQYFDIHLKPESIHFGFSPPAEDKGPDDYTKEFRFGFNENGGQTQRKTFQAPLSIPIKWKSFTESTGGTDPNPCRMVDLPALKEDMLNQTIELECLQLNSAEFAMEMVQGVPKVVFAKNTTT